MDQIHKFHIPVMGTGFTIDAPLKVAKYGINSVISIVDDVLCEQMRKYYSEKTGRPYTEITKDQDDSRALRIEKYLNLMDELVNEGFAELKASSFDDQKSEISRYFRLLPEGALKAEYQQMKATSDSAQKKKMQESLREKIACGTIDVNIMTKLDRDIYKGNEMLPHKYADAMSALRGYGNSTLNSNIIFSAGLNQKLYGYIPEFADFFPNAQGEMKKRVVMKVSDYRSALIQGKFLAKKGIWVSEYRIESGLNCGGHAFATQGFLQGPILEEFRTKRAELIDALFPVYQKALQELGKASLDKAPLTIITMQGGIGTPQEQDFLLNFYKLDRTGWGTPFLFVREVTQLDDESFEIVKKATKKESFLSDASPLGISFWNLRNSPSENYRRQRIAEGKPGSPCPKGFLVSNLEFSKKPICTASKGYQTQKLKDLPTHTEFSEKQMEFLKDLTLAKACICHDLSGGVTRRLGIDESIPTAICAGPNVINYNREFTLEEMVDHIYGRGENLVCDPERPHMFIREAELYLDYYEREKLKTQLGMAKHKPDYFVEFKQNMLEGYAYYQSLLAQLPQAEKASFAKALEVLHEKIVNLKGLDSEAQPSQKAHDDTVRAPH